MSDPMVIAEEIRSWYQSSLLKIADREEATGGTMGHVNQELDAVIIAKVSWLLLTSPQGKKEDYPETQLSQNGLVYKKIKGNISLIFFCLLFKWIFKTFNGTF